MLGRTQKNPTVEHAMEEVKGRGIPEWLSFDGPSITGRVVSMPTRQQINLPLVEGREHGISAICLSPGAVDTEMLRRANPDLRPGLTPADVGPLIVTLLDSPLVAASGANIPLFSNA